MTKKTKLLCILISVIIVLAAAIVFGYAYLAEIYEIGYQSVLYTNLSAGGISCVLLFAFSFALSFVWCKWLGRNLKFTVPEENLLDSKWLIPTFSLVCGILTAVLFTKDISENFLTAINAVPTGKVDPIFGKDISYYMLVRPFLITLRDKLSIIFTALFFLTLAAYGFFLTRGDNFAPKDILKEKKVVFHLAVSLALVFGVKVLSYRFTMENILFEQGERTGGGYTSVNVWLNFYRVIPFILLAVIILSFVFIKKSKYKMLLCTVAIYPLCFAVASVSSIAVQTLYVKPNEGSKESKYISYNIDSTRAAYNLSETAETEYRVNDNLTADIIADNSLITDNIRITDHAATLTAYNQLQGIRNFYQFIDADVVPYTENGVRKAAFVSARELTQSGELEDASYVNRRMKYTHGYGIVKSPVNRVSNEGQPDFLIKDIPLAYKDTEIKISQPRIYFGESKNDYFIVNTAQSELDFDETSPEHIGYGGKGGIKLNTFNRIVFALKNSDINLLTSSYINKDSKLLVNHNVTERVRKAAPFLDIDSDVHIAVANDGSLKWIVDCYTHSQYYPYSQYSSNGFNYIRNSVKAVVDAYDGTVSFYVIDSDDPIIQTYVKIYPNVFSSEPLPEDLKQQIKYPEWLFEIQAKIFTKYHVTDPSTFYAGSDVWAIAREKYGESAEIKDVAPYYNIMSLNGNSPEFVLMLPYTLKNKDNNLVGWLAAQTDGENYGKFVSYSFPQGKHVYGTLQVENKIDNDPDISKEITLWSQGGSSVMRGNMLVIPIDQSILYVEPLYITSENEASLPEVKRIIVSYDDEIVMEPSLNLAFEKLFGFADSQTPTVSEPSIPTENSELVNKLKEEYQALSSAAAQGNWEAFGKAMDNIGNLLNN